MIRITTRTNSTAIHAGSASLYIVRGPAAAVPEAATGSAVEPALKESEEAAVPGHSPGEPGLAGPVPSLLAGRRGGVRLPVARPGVPAWKSSDTAA